MMGIVPVFGSHYDATPNSLGIQMEIKNIFFVWFSLQPVASCDFYGDVGYNR